MRGEHESIGVPPGPSEPSSEPGAFDTLEAGGILLPPAGAVSTRIDTSCLLLAGLLHVSLLGALLIPDRGLGVGGIDMEAIGVEIVNMAPALEAREDARGRGAAHGAAAVAALDGDQVTVPEQTATRDSRREPTAPIEEAQPPPADITVRDWQEPPRPTEPAASEPIIASSKADGAAPNAPERLRPSIEERAMSVTDSIPAAELLASQQGGAAARGRDNVVVAAAVMAAARAGARDEYKLAVFRSIYVNPPRAVQGLTGQVDVKVEFAVLPGGSIGRLRVVGSSGNAQLDEAALAAVRAARVPPPPPGLSGDDLLYDMVFTFK